MAEARTVAVGLIHSCPAALAAVCSWAKQVPNAVGSKGKWLFLFALRPVYTSLVERMGFETGVNI